MKHATDVYAHNSICIKQLCNQLICEDVQYQVNAYLKVMDNTAGLTKQL